MLASGCSAPAARPSADAAGTDTATTGDGADGARGGDTGDGCNSVVQVGATVTATCAPGGAPAATGGTIADGVYFLTDSRFFGACPSSALAQTLVVSRGTVQSIVTMAAGETLRKSLRYDLLGATMLQTQSCPVNVLTRGTFTATPTTLTIVVKNALTTRVSTFTHL